MQTRAGSTRWPGLINKLPKPVLVTPMVIHWLAHSVRYLSLSLPSAANPFIETGGLAGESKFAYLAQVDAANKPWLARTVAVRADKQALEHAVAKMAEAGLSLPVIAKPDIGWCGFGVRRLDDSDSLARYIADFPANETFLLQEYLGEGGEAGLFYVRWPGQTQGSVTSLTVREPPALLGNGRDTVNTLLLRDDRLRGRSTLYEALDRIPAEGERVVLSVVWSHRTGGNYLDRTSELTPALGARLDEIARTLRSFHIARFDVRYTSLADLAAGRFKIIEINGAGSEAIDYFDNSKGFFHAYRGVLRKQAMVFALAAENQRRGVKPCGWLALLRAYWRQQSLIARYPRSN